MTAMPTFPDPLTFGVQPMSVDVFRALSEFTPYEIERAKVRVGHRRDGGYVLADLPSTSDVLSFGISNDVSFEAAMAGRGHRSFMFDHTIDSLPEENAKFSWFRTGICGSGQSSHDLLSLDEHIGRLPDLTSSLILKMDVEGAEWDVFSSQLSSNLGRFEQIVLEVHWLQRLDEPEFQDKVLRSMQTLTAHFTLFHVHANNCRPLGIVGGFAVADVLELSFVRSDLVEPRPSRTLYPSELDLGNNHAVHDHALLFYPFLPNAVGPAEVARLVDRLEADRLAGRHVYG